MQKEQKTWEKAEQKVAQKTGGKRSPGSGNGRIKGDVNSKRLCIEVKETSKKYMTFHTDWLAKILEEANRQYKIPVLAIEFGNGHQVFLSNKLQSWPLKENTIELRDRVTIKLRPTDLKEGMHLHADSGYWQILDSYELSELSKEDS
jgi:Holliday junction resolvase